ncbi:recombinase family protein [Streptomyces sp. NPDC014006]|uniref:recombinase family protein n=1 Tax=Streptomyces sp. NPDC014006 TaxID=3364870 RepID=UPI0036F683FF
MATPWWSPRWTATAAPARTWSTWSADCGAEIGFCSLHERLDTTTPGGRLVFHVFAALAEFIRELIVSGTREGLDAARARGRVGGRPTVATPEIIRAARDMLPNPENSITSIAKILGVSPGTSPTCRNSAPPAASRDSSPLADRYRQNPE